MKTHVSDSIHCYTLSRLNDPPVRLLILIFYLCFPVIFFLLSFSTVFIYLFNLNMQSTSRLLRGSYPSESYRVNNKDGMY